MIIAAIAIVGLIVGLAIGAVGIGGVVLVPVLTLALGIDVKRAIAAVMFSYLPSCIVAVTLYARRGSVPWREAWYLCLSSVPAAYLGARASHLAPAGLLEAAIGLLLEVGGLYALCGARSPTRPQAALSPAILVALGFGTGFLSALTGAGGAFVLLPALLLLNMPVLPAIGLGQAIALPIAGLASVANLLAGLVDVALALSLAVALSAGIALGTPIAHSLPQSALRRVLGVVVVAVGAAMLLRSGMRLAG